MKLKRLLYKTARGARRKIENFNCFSDVFYLLRKLLFISVVGYRVMVFRVETSKYSFCQRKLEIGCCRRLPTERTIKL